MIRRIKNDRATEYSLEVMQDLSYQLGLSQISLGHVGAKAHDGDDYRDQPGFRHHVGH